MKPACRQTGGINQPEVNGLIAGDVELTWIHYFNTPQLELPRESSSISPQREIVYNLSGLEKKSWFNRSKSDFNSDGVKTYTSKFLESVVNSYLHKMTTTNHSTKELYWTKDAFTLNYSIFEGGGIVGQIKDKSMNRTIKTSIFGTKYVFEKEGFLNPHITIFDITNRKEIGRIDFKLFRTRARIRLGNQSFYWKMVGMMGTKWNLIDEYEQVHISVKGRKEGYCAVIQDESPVLLLASLIIRNHFFKQGR